MGFTQGRGFVVGASFGLPCRTFGDACWFATPRTPPLWQRGFFLVNCFGVATLIGFGEKRCRKNLPLGATSLLEVSTRSPTPEEQRYIDRQCKPDFASLGCMALTFGIFPGFSLGLVGGWLGGFISPDAATWARYAGWLVGFVGLVYGTVWYWPNERKRRKQAETDSADTIVQELTVKSSRVAELFCPASHEPCLVFDLGDNQLLYLHGQWLRWESTYGAPPVVDDGNDDFLNLLDPPYSFPSDSFIVTRLPTSGHVFGINVTGNYLAVDDPIDALKTDFDFNDCEIIPGTINTIPDSLQTEHQRRRGT